MTKTRRDDTVSEKRVTKSYKGDKSTYINFRPLAKDSTWDELEAHLRRLVYSYKRDEHKFEELCQALLDRYDRGERTSDLKETMRQAW